MSEKAPTSGAKALEREQAKLARHELKAEEAAADYQREKNLFEAKQAFGVFDSHDSDAKIPEGEMTYEQYLQNRPDGSGDKIIHKGKQYRHAQSGRIASKADYEAQQEAMKASERALANEEANKVEAFVSPYEGMGLIQLAKEAGIARYQKNRTVEEEVREFAYQYLTSNALADDSESPEQAQARYESEFAQYESRVDAFANLARAAEEAKLPKSETVPSDASAPDETPVEGDDEPSEPAPAPGSDLVANAAANAPLEIEAAPVKTEATPATPESNWAIRAMYNGQEVGVINEYLSSLSGVKKMYEIQLPDGSTTYANEDLVDLFIPGADKRQDADEPAGDESAPDTTQEASVPEVIENEKLAASADGLSLKFEEDKDLFFDKSKASDDENIERLKAELIADEDGAAEAAAIEAALQKTHEEEAKRAAEQAAAKEAKEAQEKAEAEKKSKLKEWFKKQHTALREMGGSKLWGRKWKEAEDAPSEGVNGYTLNYEVKPDDTAEQREKKHKRNRIRAIAGVAALAVIGLGAIDIDLASDAHAKQEVTQGFDNLSPLSAGELGGEGISVESDTIPLITAPSQEDLYGQGFDNLSPTEGRDVDVVQGHGAWGEEEEQQFEGNFNVASGTGGEQLFQTLGFEPADWYQVEDQLLENFPQDFYRMNDGHVGISHSGMLSQATQDYISSLK